VIVDPDRELVDRARRGDLRAFEELVERHRAVVFRVAARVVGREEAEDVSQDAFLRAFHRLERFRGESPFRSWLLQIAHNTALTALSRRRAEPAGSAAEVETAGSEAVHDRQPVDLLEERERMERLELKLRELRPEHRAVLVLRDLEDLSYDEIAEVTETPLGSVKARLHRARRELIDLLRRNLYDWNLPDER
jgi:RNA polymerase sigma-70 factor (ECF subfamily)